MIFRATISQILCIFFVFVSLCHALSPRVSQDFEAKLYTNINAEKPTENLLYSPLSIETCLAMTRMAANGITAYEIDTTMAQSSQDRTEVAQSYYEILRKYQNSEIFKMANKIYYKKGYAIKRSFYDFLRNNFFGNIAGLNFAKSNESAKAINSWVEEETNNKIKDLISEDQLNRDTRLVLVNAVYFKGKWASKFDESLTNTQIFILEDNSTFDVEMMFQRNKFDFADIKELQARALNLPYENSNFSMLILLPHKRLSDMEETLKTYPLTKIFTEMKKVSEELGDDDVDVYLPRFKYEFKVDLKKPLINMGIQQMFSDDAELNEMLHNVYYLQVSSIVHKAVIEVDEEGSVAAAATKSVFVNRIGGLQFVVNRPFHFFIVDMTTYDKIFEGRINSEFTSKKL